MNGEQTTMLATSGSKSGLMKPTNQKVAEAVARINRDKEESSATTFTPEVSETLETAETESTDAPKETSETKIAAAPKTKAKAKPVSKPVKAKASAKAKAKVKAKSVKAVKAKSVKAKPVKAKAAKAKAAKAVKPAKAKATKPMSGQSGPALSLTAADLNKNETKLLCSFGDYKGGEEISIAELAKETFPSKPKAQANSWVRNALRRLVRADLVSKTDRGTYKLTKAGRSLV